MERGYDLSNVINKVSDKAGMNSAFLSLYLSAWVNRAIFFFPPYSFFSVNYKILIIIL